MKLDPLAQMHLLLREHGWEPEESAADEGGTVYYWTHVGCDSEITTAATVDVPAAWFIAGQEPPASTSVEDLRRRLQELAES
jgi:hypothetical protein